MTCRFLAAEIIPVCSRISIAQVTRMAAMNTASTILVMAGWAVLFGFLANRFFRWE